MHGFGSWTTLLAQAGPDAGAGAAAGGGGELPFWVLLAGIGALFVFIVLIPEQKEKRKRQDAIDNLKKGDRVVTTGGIYGAVSSVKDKEKFVLRVEDQNTLLTVARASIARIINPNEAKDKDKSKSEKEEDTPVADKL